MDAQGIKKSAPFYRQVGITHLDIYNDTRAALLEALNEATRGLVNRPPPCAGAK